MFTSHHKYFSIPIRLIILTMKQIISFENVVSLTQCLRGKLCKRKVSSEKESLLCSTKHKLSKRDLAIVFKGYSHTCEQSNF